MLLPFKPCVALCCEHGLGKGLLQQCSDPDPFSSSCCNGSNKRQRARKSDKLENLPGGLCVMEAPADRVAPQRADRAPGRGQAGRGEQALCPVPWC